MCQLIERHSKIHLFTMQGCSISLFLPYFASFVHTGQLSMDVSRMNELVPEANLPARASEVLLSQLQRNFHVLQVTSVLLC